MFLMSPHTSNFAQSQIYKTAPPTAQSSSAHFSGQVLIFSPSPATHFRNKRSGHKVDAEFERTRSESLSKFLSIWNKSLSTRLLTRWIKKLI